jgi:hypothetical protein
MLENIEFFLPKYLSAESMKNLMDGLKDFPNNIDQRIYSEYLENDTIFQGDCLKDMVVVNIENLDVKHRNCMIISNTCDMVKEYDRVYTSQIIYIPIMPLDSYKENLKKYFPEERVNSHVESIRKQRITQLFYLPCFEGRLEESIAFLDRIFNVNSKDVSRENLNDTRLFSLSDYGNYLFLFKLSMHLTRIQDKVDRRSTLV